MNKQDYVLGFAFSASQSHIVLMRKNRPAWQAGKLNGLGGKIELNEKPVDAMCREFAEETGVATTANEWTHFAELELLQRTVHCFRLFNDKIHDVRTMEDEPIEICAVDFDRFRQEAVSNCAWLIGLALDDNALLTGVTARYTQDHTTSYRKAER